MVIPVSLKDGRYEIHIRHGALHRAGEYLNLDRRVLVVTDDGVTEETRRRVQTLIHCIDDAIDIHDFRMVAGPTHTNLIFDAVVPFGFRLTDQEVEQKIRSAVRALDGNYYAVVNVERSYT